MKIFLIGVAGRGMSRLAEFCLLAGYDVYGSDTSEKPIISRLELLGVKVFKNHKKSNIATIDIVVKSAGIKANNIELIEAKKLKLSIYGRSEFLNFILNQNNNRLICVTGSYGKTTTTSFFGKVIEDTTNYSLYVGDYIPNLKNAGVSLNSNSYAFIEACEYKKEFYSFNPEYLVVLNIEENHLDFYGSMKKLKIAFINFINKSSNLKSAILCINSKGVSDILEHIEKPYETYGYNEGLWQVRNLASKKEIMTFDIFKDNRYIRSFESKLSGLSTALNILAVFIISSKLKGKLNIKKLENEIKLPRRFEIKINTQNLLLIDDNARSPEQLDNTYSAIKLLYPEKKIFVFAGIWGKLNKRNLDSYFNVLKKTDYIYLFEVAKNGVKYGGAESDTADKDLKKLFQKTQKCQVYLEKTIDINDVISNVLLLENDIVFLTIGYDSYINKFESIEKHLIKNIL